MTLIQEASIRELAARGLSSNQMLKHLGCSYGVLWGNIKRYRIKLPKGSPGNRVLTMQGIAQCSRCSRRRPLTAKSYKKQSWDCHDCTNQRALELRETFGGRITSVLSLARFRARKRKMEFDIDRTDIIGLWEKQNKRCVYTDVEMTIKSNLHNTVSLDRVDSSKGYTKDNVVLCCSIVNLMKLDLSTADFRRWCRLVVDHDPGSSDISKNPRTTLDSRSVVCA